MHLSVNPAFFYGPFAPAFTAPYGSSSINGSIISSMILFYKLLLPDAPPSPLEFSPFFTDIRDAAQALVAAIDSPPSFPSFSLSPSNKLPASSPARHPLGQFQQHHLVIVCSGLARPLLLFSTSPAAPQG